MEISMEQQPLLVEMLVLFLWGFRWVKWSVHGPFYGQYHRIAYMYQSVRGITRSGSSHKSYIATDLGYVVSAYFVDYWLVVLTILKNISRWEGLSHILWKNTKCSKPPTRKHPFSTFSAKLPPVPLPLPSASPHLDQVLCSSQEGHVHIRCRLGLGFFAERLDMT